MKKDSPLYSSDVDDNTPIFDDDYHDDLLLPGYPVLSAAIGGLLALMGLVLAIGIVCGFIEMIISLVTMLLA